MTLNVGSRLDLELEVRPGLARRGVSSLGRCPARADKLCSWLGGLGASSGRAGLAQEHIPSSFGLVLLGTGLRLEDNGKKSIPLDGAHLPSPGTVNPFCCS